MLGVEMKQIVSNDSTGSYSTLLSRIQYFRLQTFSVSDMSREMLKGLKES